MPTISALNQQGNPRTPTTTRTPTTSAQSLNGQPTLLEQARLNEERARQNEITRHFLASSI